MSQNFRKASEYDLNSREATLLLGLCENLARALLAQRRIYETSMRKKKEASDIDLSRSAEAIIRYDENMLLTSAWKALRFLDVAAAEGILPKELLEPFVPLRGPLKDVRDMREHEDEYRLGEGRARKRYVHHDAETKVAASADWTVVVGSRHMIGNRLPFSDFWRAIRQLFLALKENEFWILPWEDLGVAEYGPLPTKEDV